MLPHVVIKINYRKNEKMSYIVSVGDIKKHLRLFPALSGSDKAQLLLHFCAESGQSFPFDKEAGKSSYLPEQVVPVEGRCEIIPASTASCANAGADDTGHHAHVPIAPGTKLFVYFKQLMQDLERQLQQRISPVKHNEQRGPAG